MNVKINNSKETSLFPVVLNDEDFLLDNQKEELSENKKLEWLENKSFPIEILSQINQTSPVCDKNLISTTEKAIQKKRKKKFRSDDHKKNKTNSAKKQCEDHNSSSTKNFPNFQEVFIDDLNLLPEHAFRIDRKKDASIVSFSVMYPTYVARYKKVPILLGNTNQRKKMRSRSNRYYVQIKKHQKKSQSEEIFSLIPKVSNSVYQNNTTSSDFLPLEVKFTEPQKENILEKMSVYNPLGIYDPVTAAYGIGRDILHHLDEKQQKIHQNFELNFKNEIERLNCSVRENCHNIDAWLELIHYQDVLAKESNISSVVNVEKKVAILDHALNDNPGSIPLLLEKLELCKDLWESEHLHKEWSSLLFAHPNNLLLWIKYLFFIQTYFQSFSVKRVIHESIKCIQKLTQIQQGQFQSHSCPSNIEEKMLEIISSYCWLLMQSGYRERAIATFQALLEFNINSTEDISKSDELLRFELFWDSRLPRLGEKESQGWYQTLLNKPQTSNEDNFLFSREIDDLTFEIVESDISSSEAWLRVETLRERYHWQPILPECEDDVEDSDRIVSFEDISPFLIKFSGNQYCFYLASQFLINLGVPVYPLSVAELTAVNGYDITRLCHFPPYITYSPFLYHSPPLSSVFNQLESLGPNCLTLLSDDKYVQFIYRIFDQICAYITEPYKSVLYAWKIRFVNIRIWIAFQQDEIQRWKSEILEMRKQVKSILRREENRNSVILYLEFAQLESMLKRYEEGRKILLTSLFSVLPGSLEYWRIIYALILLYWTTDDEKLISEWKQGMINLLCSCVSGQIVTVDNLNVSVAPFYILKTRKIFQKLITDLSNNQTEKSTEIVYLSQFTPHIVCVIVAFGCLQQLTSSCNDAVFVFESALNRSCHDAIQRELVFSAYLLMLLFVQRHQSFSLSNIRNVLNQALLEFPINLFYLKLFIDIESRCSVSCRMRQYFGKRGKQKHPWESIWAVLGEMSRHERIIRDSEENSFPVTGHLHRILHVLKETLFEKGPSVHCVLLWRIYLLILHLFDFKSQIPRVFFMAVQSCPWAKILYVDAIRYMPNLLEQVEELMMEKELRVRLPLEELKVLMEKYETESNHNEDENKEPLYTNTHGNNDGAENNEQHHIDKFENSVSDVSSTVESSDAGDSN